MGTIKIDEALSAYQTSADRCGTVHGKLRVIINRYLVAPRGRHAEQTRETHGVTAICDRLQSGERIRGEQSVQAPLSYDPAKPPGSNGRRGVRSGYLWLTECIVTYGGKEIRTSTVDGNLLAPEELSVSVRARPSQLGIQWILDFNPLLMELRLGEYLKGTQVEPTPQFDLRDPQALRLVQALKCDIDQGCPAGTVFAERIGGALSVYLAHRNSPNSGALAGRVASPRFTRVLEYIRANLDHDIHIPELAGAAGLSLFHFAKLFKRSTGSSPHQYILHRRLERATELLRNTQLSLSEIALQAGFADQSHLTNVFRRVNGVTPSRFRHFNALLLSPARNQRTSQNQGNYRHANHVLGRRSGEPPEIDDARETLSRILKEIHRAADIVEQNCSLYRRDTPKRELVDINELIREMIALLYDSANHHSISIRTGRSDDFRGSRAGAAGIDEPHA